MHRPPLILTSGLAAAALSLLAAGCGGSPSTPAVATGPAATNAAKSPAGGAPQATGLLAYATCMRSHGVPTFPDPASSGGIPKEAVIGAEAAVSNTQVQAAQTACEDLLAAGGSLSGKASQPVTAQDRKDYLKAAACMRAHGIANFPDPTFLGNQVEFPGLSQLVDSHSTQFTQALHTCQRRIPAGLPESGSAG